MSSKILLSNAELKFDSDTPTNAYVYMSSNSNHSSGNISCDIGLISAPSHNGGWYLISSRKQDATDPSVSISDMNYFYSSPIVKSKENNGVYTPEHDVYMYYSYGNGTVYCQIQNAKTGLVQEGYINDYRFNTASPNICLMSGTSLVPDLYDYAHVNGQTVETQVAADIKCGAYLKNVIWSENKIYKQSLWTGTPYSFAGTNSSTTNYLLTYDTDNASCYATDSTDTINIFYDSTYKK